MAQRVTRALLEEDAQCAQTALYWSLQCRIDYYMAVHLPSETQEMAKMVDAGLRECYAEVLGKDLLSPEGVTLRDGTPVTVDNGFQRDRALLKTRHGGLGYRLHEERCLFLNSLNNIAPLMVGGARPLWKELRGTLGGEKDFHPTEKERRWVTFFASESRYGAELRAEIIRMKDLYVQTCTEAGHEVPKEHGVFDAEPESFGVRVEEGGGEVHKLQRALMDTIKPLRAEGLKVRAEALHPNDARRAPYLQAGWSRTANTIYNNAPTQRKEFKLEEEFQTAALRNQAAPVRAIDSLNFCRFQTPNSANVSTRVDPFGNNLFLGSLKEEDADGVTRTRCRCNLRGRMRRSHDGFQNWVSHWLKVARIPHRGGAKGRPNTCKGMFSQECAQLEVPRKDGETDEEYEDRHEKLLNSIIADICIDLRHTELGDPTKELKALLGYQHLVDFKTLLPGQRYRADTDATTGSVVNGRQEEVSPDYEKKATKLDSHVPGDAATPFQDRLKTFGINGRVLGPTVGAWCEVSEDFDLILDLIAHALADEETSTIQVPHHQSVARQKSKLVADFGLMMHLTWARQLLDNREFVLVEGRHPSSDPNHGRDDAGYDSEEEERDLHHQDMYMNGGRNHHFGPPPTQEG